MPVTVTLSNRLGRGPASIHGPFATVEITHRQVRGDGIVVALRGGDGAWHSRGDRFLEVVVDGVDALEVHFDEPWGDRVSPIRASTVRLMSDGLWVDAEAEAAALDYDDGHCWVVQPGGYVCGRLKAA